jgi:hypothetical protein
MKRLGLVFVGMTAAAAMAAVFGALVTRAIVWLA